MSPKFQLNVYKTQVDVNGHLANDCQLIGHVELQNEKVGRMRIHQKELSLSDSLLDGFNKNLVVSSSLVTTKLR